MNDTLIPTDVKPKLAFLGVGWIGRNRMEAVVKGQRCETVAISDPAEECGREALHLAPEATLYHSQEAILHSGADGLVIATPSALHAEQSMAALQKGMAVFCQKPLARTATEARAVVDAARQADRLLGLDLSYRYTKAVRALYQLVRSGELGDIYAVNLVFHNAYGPDKAWFYDPKLSGGGCVIDLGVHLVDLALWILDFPEIQSVNSQLYAKGVRLQAPYNQVEDYATATIDVAGGATLQVSCSWNLPAGQEAIIEATFYGSKGGAAFKNVNGSFYDFVAERYRGIQSVRLTEPPDEWGGRAAVDWANRLANGERFSEEAEEFVKVAEVIDQMYGR